jgi:hypothetical protein
VAPVPKHIANVQMVGIARLRYRAQTAATTAWWRNLQEQADSHLAVYGQLDSSAEERRKQV